MISGVVQGELEVAGNTTFGTLSGSGDQMVVVDNTGLVSSQEIPVIPTPKRSVNFTGTLLSYSKISGNSTTSPLHVDNLPMGTLPGVGYAAHAAGKIVGCSFASQITWDVADTFTVEVLVNGAAQTALTLDPLTANNGLLSAGLDTLNIPVAPGDNLRLQLNHLNNAAQYNLTSVIVSLLVEYDA
ncbi:MAG: hypothetical protein AAFQ98_25280 [Bacteroidota bacterium]